MKNKILLFFFVILSIKYTVGEVIKCYSCTETTPGCGAIYNSTNKAPEKTCEDNDVCVVFRNKYDNFRYTRGCSKDFYVPPNGVYDPVNKDDVVKDKFTLELFYFCSTELCNVNAANDTIFNINECKSSPCLNSGKCVDKYNKYKCECNGNFGGDMCEKCQPGFSGTDCKTEPPEKPCDFDPQLCKNKGTCANLEPMNYKCTCIGNFIGINCEIDACNPNPCLNSAKCRLDDAKTDFECADCPPGFKGKRCEINIDECEPKPCKNGTCLDQVNSYICVCPPGITGKDCDTDIDECKSSPCNVNGTVECQNLVNGFKCNCKIGYAGVRCESDINECASNPCKNGATCLDNPGGFKCICTEHFSGKTCSAPIYHCDFDEPDACSNHGDCTGGIGTQPVVCTCFEGYNGTRCEIKISICNTNNPCKNGGTCVDGDTPTSYTCTCPKFYDDGKNCEIFNSPCNTTTLACKNGGVCGVLNDNAVCNCATGFNGDDCNNEYFKCETQGTFPDTFHCAKYINCYDQGDGKIVKEGLTCGKIGSTQLLFHPTLKSCVLPSKHPNPACVQ